MPARPQDPPEDRAEEAFDTALERLRAGEVELALDGLVAWLAAARRSLAPAAWARLVAQARRHPLREFLHRDPFAFRCFSKPRGYVPDGPALDFVLRARELPVRSSDPLGGIHHYLTHGQTARALRYRRDGVARQIDETASRARRPARVFAAASGHLRECDRAVALRGGGIAELVAFDTDAENLDAVRRDYAGLPVAPRAGTMQQLLEARRLAAGMDLAYCCGLLETAGRAQALALARELFAVLKPGGTLLLTQVLSGLDEAAFLEAFLDWPMVLRQQSELFELVRELPQEEVAGWAYAENGERTVALVAIRRDGIDA